VNIIDIDYSTNKRYQTKELTLENDAKVIIKQSSNTNITISFYLKTPNLYQTRLDSGVEKIILLYIKEIFTNALLRNNLNLASDLSIEGNTDFSRFSFAVDPVNVNKILSLFLDSLLIKEWDLNLLDEILSREKNNFINNYKTNNEFYINYSLEKYVFNANPVFNSFDGNSVSLVLLNFDTINEYYNNNFSGKRMLLLIYGNVDSNFNFNFVNFSSNFKIKDFSERTYNRFVSSRFKLTPYYLPVKESNKNAILMAFYKSPSFLNDEYFTYLVTLEILKENANLIFPETAKIRFDSMMINITNYGRILFYAKPENILQKILTFRRLIDFYKNGLGFLFYYDKENDSIIREYKNQTDDKLVSMNINYILRKAKNKVLSDYNFTDLNSVDKEKKYIAIYFLLNKEISYFNIKERIEIISYEDIVVLAKKIFTNFSWAVATDPEQLKKISKDFFTL